jgi:hypothetical protein
MQSFIYLILFVLASQAQASEIEPQDCYDAGVDILNCKCPSFHTIDSNGVNALFYISDQSSAGDTEHYSRFFVDVNYFDQIYYFDRVAKLYPYIDVTRAKYFKDGRIERTTERLFPDMPFYNELPNRYYWYKMRFSLDIRNSDRSYVEGIESVAFAFTNEFPHTGTAKWDWDEGKNFNIPLELKQGLKEDDGLNCYSFHGSKDLCEKAGCYYETENQVCTY